jgi:glucose/arabinose dehydrogenase
MIGSAGSATGWKERFVRLVASGALRNTRGALRAGLAAALAAAALASAAAAQPVIRDPDPDDPDVDWGLRLEEVVSGLDAPSALVFFGPRIDEEFLVLEKNTGRVRHFVRRVEQPVALDLAVDNCGERGLVDIALHPFFDPTPTPVTDPPTERDPNLDWVYVSYFTTPGRTSDGCDGGEAELHVDRMKWDITTGTLVPDPLVAPDPDPDDAFEPFVPFVKTGVDGTTAVGGALTMDLQLTSEAVYRGRLYISIGSLGHTTGRLQNNESADPNALDDTSVILRLDENGELPAGNPFDVPDEPDTAPPDDRYFLYGVRNPRRLTLDPFIGFSEPTLWFTDQSDGATLGPKPDEIMLGLAGSNGGYGDYQGLVLDPLASGDEGYPLVDLARNTKDEPVGTYLNPSFSFEDKAVDPTALEFGGLEVGSLNIGALFVGASNGQLFRFALSTARVGFLLGNTKTPADAPLADRVASPGDDLSSILVAEGFGAISDIARGVDGSLYVLGSATGAIHHVFSDARRDLVLSKVKVPRRVTLKPDPEGGEPETVKNLRVTIENRGEVIERILSRDELTTLLQVQVTPAAGSLCTALPAEVQTPWYASPPYEFAIGIKPRGKLTLDVKVTWKCDAPTPQDVPDFETTAQLDGTAIGSFDEDTTNDVCPRPPAAKDKGCGAKDGALTTDLIEK